MIFKSIKLKNILSMGQEIIILLFIMYFILNSISLQNSITYSKKFKEFEMYIQIKF